MEPAPSRDGTWSAWSPARHPGYSTLTVADAIKAHARADDGALTRVRAGLYSLRARRGAVSAAARTGRDWMLAALLELAGPVSAPVTRRQLEQRLESWGVHYSRRAVTAGLSALVQDPASAVTRPSPGIYVVGQVAVGEAVRRQSGRREG